MRDWESGLLWCLGAFAIYLLGRSYSSDADILTAVPRVNQLGELATLLNSESARMVVGVSGKVQSETPIKCEFGDLQGVVVKQRAVQKFLKRDQEDDWIEDSALMFSTLKEVPWYLDDGTGRVNVVGAQRASDFILPAESAVFEHSSRCLICEKKRCLEPGFRQCETERCRECDRIDYSKGLKILGVKRIEQVLPVGTYLSVIGEAIKDGVGTIRIQKPYKGPFHVSTKSIDELIASHRNWERFLKYASFGLAVIGVTLIAMGFHEYIMVRQRRLEWQRSLRSASVAAAIRTGKDNEGSNERAVDASDGTNSCVICLEQEYNVVFVPCGHLCCCTTCCLNLSNCPLCRQRIVQVVRTFQP